MQNELLDQTTGSPIQLFAINEAGEAFQAAVPAMAALGTLPILQDTEEAAVWTSLGITYRDVLILDEENRWRGVYNLTTHDLSQPGNYEDLATMLFEVAGSELPHGVGPGDGAAGQPLYDAYCGMCHGDSGEGYVSDNANALANQDFLASVSDRFLYDAIWHGRPGTPMPAWGLELAGPLSDGDADDIVAYMRSWQTAGSVAVDGRIVSGDAAAAANNWNERCASCHGAAGGGATAASVNNPWLLETASDGFLRYAIAQGRTGTTMPAFTGTLTDQEIDDLVALIRSWAVPVSADVPPPFEPDLSAAVINDGGPTATFTLSEDRFVSADDVNAAVEAGQEVVILDARPSSDYLHSHIAGAISVPFYDVEAAASELPADTWIVTYCGCPHTLSGQAADTLTSLGFNMVGVLDEGFYGWLAKGYPSAEGAP